MARCSRSGGFSTEAPGQGRSSIVLAILLCGGLSAPVLGQTQIIAITGNSAPDGNGTFSSFIETPVPNDAGQAAFFAYLTGTSGGTSDDSGIFRGDGGAVTQIVREGQAAPDANGTFSGLSIPALNDAGQAAFSAFLTGTSGGASDDSGIFRGDGGVLTQVAREGQAAPDANGTFSVFNSLALNDAGQAAFSATLTGTSGGTSDDGGIFLANGIDTLQVAREGDALGGSTISSLALSVGASERDGINDAGQVAYWAELANGDSAIVLYTIPDIHWTATGSGNWSTDGNWTQATEPNSFHDTFIDPPTSQTVTAPSSHTTVASLTLGGGTGTATLRLAGTSAGDVRALEASTIESNGVLHLTDGRTFVAPALDNAGMIHGDGTVDAPVSNSGQIESVGGQLVFSQLVSNNASTGLITGRDAIFRFNGGLTNDGAVALSFGTSDIHGDIDNGGNIVVTGNSNATFYDDVDNGGAVNVSAGSAAVFLGALTGNGTNGTGTVFLEGDVQPGDSPALMTFGGDVHFGFFSELEIELGGFDAEIDHDQLVVTGAADLAGTLEVTLIDPAGGSNIFQPSLGDTFEIVTAGEGVSGAFANESFPDLGSLLVLDAFYDTNTVTLAVVPALPGDYNGDGKVGAGDYTVWRNALGEMGVGLVADGTGDDLLGIPDGVVDGFDYDFWKLHYGDTLGTGSTFAENSGSVPEPASLVLALLAAVGWLVRGRPGAGAQSG